MFASARRAAHWCGLLATVATSALALVAAPLLAQSFISHDASLSVIAHPAASRIAGYRPAAGERALYELRLAGREVGSGSLEVLGEERLEGHRTLHTSLQVEGGILFAKVDDRFESWIDPERLFSRRFVQTQRELRNRRHRDYRMIPEERSFREAESGEQDTLTSQEPLDDLSFLFYTRSLPLHVGDVDTIPRYFKAGHDVILRVLRRERVEVPAGTFETIVVQPTITNVGGLFGQGGQAEIYLSDDPSRTLVLLRSHVPVLGSISLRLKEVHTTK